MTRSPNSRSATRDLALRAVHLTTGVVTVAAMGATGALTGALATPPVVAPTSSTPAPPVIKPMPRRTLHVPAKTVRVELRVGAAPKARVTRTTRAARPRTVTRQPVAKRASVKATLKAPVVTSGAS